MAISCKGQSDLQALSNTTTQQPCLTRQLSNRVGDKTSNYYGIDRYSGLLLSICSLTSANTRDLFSFTARGPTLPHYYDDEARTSKHSLVVGGQGRRRVL